MSKAEDRQRLVAKMRREGMSLRGIGAELHVSQVTIMRDVRAIEERTGEPLADYVSGEDGKYYLPKTTVQEYETEAGYDEPADVEPPLSVEGHLTNALSELQHAADALRATGVRDPAVPALLAEIRSEAARLLAANKALPKAKTNP